MLEAVYDKILKSLGKRNSFPTEEEIESIIKFNEKMDDFNKMHKHEIGENPLLKRDYSSRLNFSKYVPKSLRESRPYGRFF